MNEAYYMQRCLQLAEKGKGRVAPNPMVGALLVHEGRIIGEGWHQQLGGAHAEVQCLESVSGADKHLIPDATMYVSLEPCAHQGRTPSCAHRIVQEGIRNVVVCNDDPFEKVAGKGYAILEQQGIAVKRGVAADAGRWVNRRFFCFHEKKRPYIILKWAQTNNGYFAPSDRSRLAISHQASQELVHKWRTEEPAIMVGYTTALNDNPRLTARLFSGRQPLRLVLDKDLNIPSSHHVFDADAPTWILNRHAQKTAGNIQWMKLHFSETLLDETLQLLHQNEVQSILIEGGAQLLQSFIDKGLWDEARIFTATNVTLQEGIAAPILKQAHGQWETTLQSDRLQFFTRQPLVIPQGFSL